MTTQCESNGVSAQHTFQWQWQSDSSSQQPSVSDASTQQLAELVTVRPESETQTRQGLPYFVGISQATAGAKNISMSLVTIPPGGCAEPHFHRDYESAIYLLKGRVETRYGAGLKQSVINEAGDFLFIPPGVPHQPYNLDPDEPAQAIVARSDSNEREKVVLYNPTLER